MTSSQNSQRIDGFYSLILRSVWIWMSISFIHILNLDSKCKFYLRCSTFTNFSCQCSQGLWAILSCLWWLVFSCCQGPPLCDCLSRPSWVFFPFPFCITWYFLALKCKMPLSPFAFFHPIFLCTKFAISGTWSLPRMPNVGQLMLLWKAL